jgi:hypothetical protein
MSEELDMAIHQLTLIAEKTIENLQITNDRIEIQNERMDMLEEKVRKLEGKS